MKIASISNIDQDALIYSSIPESTATEYDGGTTYVIDEVVKVSYESDGITARRPIYLYKSLADSNVGNYPPDSPSQWLNIGATNRWAMFDPYVNTQSESSDDIEFGLDVSNQNTITLLNLNAQTAEMTFIVNKEMMSDMTSDSYTKGTGWSYDSTNDEYSCDGSQVGESKLYQGKAVKGIYYQVSFTVENYSAGNIAGYAGQAGEYVSGNGTYTQIIAGGSENKLGVVADADFVGTVSSILIKKVPKKETISLEYYGIVADPSYYEYFFGAVNYIKDLIWQYPYYPNAKINVKLTKKPGENVLCGSCNIGSGTEIAKTQFDPTIEVLDYSRFEEDSTTGRVYHKKGNNAKRLEMQCWLETDEVDAVRRILESYVGKPIVLDGNNAQSNFSSLIAFGILRDQSLSISGPTMSRLDVEMRGFV